ncbi:helix-turn-helix domain-containing protein [Adhaeribacter radiodurans]|uniref:Helix-turn-helix transcriptional regulator n=1 Tax=Adhaeribacter radiodurans TaxID=2745197 RepID=A0A7L7LCR7_9BACT|nr:helix-turn-helix transcriptional regulator [Adhaeribacter radiodurans]QMU30611.1 helix-turn-helix transcriptional regulator [Adhaeribacter radiodurans]
MEALPKISVRQRQIRTEFLKELDKHILDVATGRVETMFEIKEFANLLHIHPRHLTNTVKLTTGKHPCFYFEERILAAAKQMLSENKMSIAQIATLLTYDPSNFTKFFKRYTGQTPKQFREEVVREKAENLTI